MRNVPKYYNAEKLQERQVLKFDIRNPDPSRQLWGRRGGNSEHAFRECLIETTDQIQEKGKHAPRAEHKGKNTEGGKWGESIPKKCAYTKTTK